MQFVLYRRQPLFNARFHRTVKTREDFRNWHMEDDFVGKCDQESWDGDRSLVSRDLNFCEEAENACQFPLAETALLAMRPKIIRELLQCHEFLFVKDQLVYRRLP